MPEDAGNMELTATPGGLHADIDIDAPINQRAEDTEHNKLFLDSIPDGYADREWVKNLIKHSDPWAEMFKKYDNQLSLIGKKAEGLSIPGEKASEDEWKAFYKAIGVSDKAEDYKYEPPNVPDNLKPYFEQDEDLLKVMREAAQKAGVTPTRWKHITDTFDSYYLGKLDSYITSANKQLDNLKENFYQRFGDKADVVLNDWTSSLSSTVSPESIAIIESLDPRVKVILAEERHNFKNKYVREDSLNVNIPSTGHQMSQVEYGDEYERVFAKVRQSKPGTAERIQADQELVALKARGAQIFKVK